MTKIPEAALKAGWNPADGQPFLKHSMPPPIDDKLGHNGIAPTKAKLVRPSALRGDSGLWAQVWAEHQGNVGYVSETPQTPYHNPWTEELGIGDVEFCIAAATIIPHHHGVQWWPEAQFGAKGYAYCPYGESGAQNHGMWEVDLASRGQPARLVPGDLVLYDWNGDGVADHCETIVNLYGDLTFDTIGYDTGTPNGCHFPIRRDRTYLLGVMHMSWVYGGPPIPPPNPESKSMYSPPLPPIYCSTNLPGGGVLAIGKDGASYYLNPPPGFPSHPGMNTDPKDWGSRTPQEVRVDTRYPNMPFVIKDTSVPAEFYGIGYQPGQSELRW